MKRAICYLLTPLFAVSLGGCIEFKEQTLSYHHDEATDTVRIFQDYRGIFGAGDDGKKKKKGLISAKEVSQLSSVLEGQRTFFFTNWIFEYDREDIEEELEDLKDPLKEKKEPWHIPKEEKILKFLLKNVHIENGPFYLEAGDRLCGVQAITIDNVSGLVAALNEFGPAYMNTIAEHESTSPGDRAALVEFRKRDDHGLVMVDGNAFTFRWPMSKESYDKEFGDKVDDPEALKAIRKAGLGITFADNVATFTLGKSDQKITRLTLPFSEDDYICNALETARELHRVKEDFDPAAAADKFLLPADKKKK